VKHTSKAQVALMATDAWTATDGSGMRSSQKIKEHATPADWKEKEHATHTTVKLQEKEMSGPTSSKRSTTG
jgi:hypothetical protein